MVFIYLFLGDNEIYFIIEKIEIVRKWVERRIEVFGRFFIKIFWLV